MKYICELCNYATDVKFAYERHSFSKKHVKNIEKNVNKQPYASRMNPVVIIEKHIKKVYTCQFCNNKFANAGNLARHYKACPDKKGIESIYTKDIEKYKKEIKHLKKINIILENDRHKWDEDKKQLNNAIHHYQSLLNNAGTVVKTSISALSYVIKNYKNAPTLEKLTDYSYIQYKDEEDDFDLLAMIFTHHQNKTLHQYLGDFIVNAYKKDDPDEQSLWSSDTVRLTYIIKELLDKKGDWTVDKKGDKTKKYIIDPLLEYIMKLLATFLDDNALENYLHDSKKRMQKRMCDINSAAYIIADIKNNNLAPQIIKYIAPHFYLTKPNELIEI